MCFQSNSSMTYKDKICIPCQVFHCSTAKACNLIALSSHTDFQMQPMMLSLTWVCWDKHVSNGTSLSWWKKSTLSFSLLQVLMQIQVLEAAMAFDRFKLCNWKVSVAVHDKHSSAQGPTDDIAQCCNSVIKQCHFIEPCPRSISVPASHCSNSPGTLVSCKVEQRPLYSPASFSKYTNEQAMRYQTH